MRVWRNVNAIVLETNGKAYSYFHEFKAWCFEFIGNACVICGSLENLEIDHVNRKDKSFNITSEWSSKSQLEIETELKKCQPLCSGCHKTKTAKELSIDKMKEPSHGSIYAWMKKKCLCDVCTASKNEWNAKRRGTANIRGSYNMSKSHGETKYKQGCRCDICKSIHAEKAREYNNKQKRNLEAVDGM